MRNKNMGVLCQVGDSSIAYWYWTKKGRWPAYLAIRSTSTGELLKKLAEKGLIQKEVDPKDKRSHLISLTEAGKEEAQRMKEKRSKAHQEMLTYLTAEEKQAFGQALAKIEQFYLEKEADVDWVKQSNERNVSGRWFLLI